MLSSQCFHCWFWTFFHFAGHKDYFDLRVISAVDPDSWQQKIDVSLSGKGYVTSTEKLHCLFGCGEAFFYQFKRTWTFLDFSVFFPFSFSLDCPLGFCFALETSTLSSWFHCPLDFPLDLEWHECLLHGWEWKRKRHPFQIQTLYLSCSSVHQCHRPSHFPLHLTMQKNFSLLVFWSIFTFFFLLLI